ncbi:ectoine/hydroxyectoine ABC transporter permease subunit EhuC [Saccharopolyspora rhizosphaerae]|uniref:Ectoine/hydroxyectoine ABC transporter permease subunit EhuC n=1 Tax=Saccharopolyspora rhizosphaerae TaxID=2492662 RepID=A0A3R8VCJ0_9PSEU|nr:ectoine/hydroxyectoine ABC transporter permease subunit EhuC [Saccharopolyspora rhizosphaerae]RRO14764.1 ectoine/hydroxyectoine ABC transporter permease subunit EhuC [Saccharopolyspora rhizosphaerae]
MSEILPYFPLLGEGLLITIALTLAGTLLAVVVAFVAGIARMSRRRWVRWPASVFIEVFRGTSMLVQLFWLFFALPFFGVQLVPYAAAILALGLNEGAYGAEIVRGAITALPRGQREGAIALSLSPYQRMRFVILPQAVPAMIPPFGNVMVDLLKNTSLVSLVTVADLTFTAQMVRNTTGATAAVFGTILVLYFVVAYVLSLGSSWVERKVDPTRPAQARSFWQRVLPDRWVTS